MAQTPLPNLPFIAEDSDTMRALAEVAKIFTPIIENLKPVISVVNSQNYFHTNLPNKYNLPAPMNMPPVLSPQPPPTVTSPRVQEIVNNISQPPYDNLPITNNNHYYTSTKPWYPIGHHIYDETGRKETLDSIRASPQGDVWEQALSNEWGRLAHGNKNGVQYTDTICFIKHADVPPNNAITYASFVCDH